MATHVLSRQGQSQTNAVKAQDYGNSVLGPVRCFAGGHYATRNNDKLKCLLSNSTEAPKDIAKQTVRPDLVPSDFHLLRYLKRSLGGKRFSDNEERKAAVNS
ncbi:hypothetical protein TNCV_4864481 [Trichonephila clavipes]|nr:hypothetical protein TNCV_4864481 [Trichonephila clavipes]